MAPGPSGHIESFPERKKSTKEQLADLKTKVDSLHSDTESLKKSDADLMDKIAPLEQRVTTLAQDIPAKVAQWKEAIDAAQNPELHQKLEMFLTEVKEKMQKIKEKLEAVKTNKNNLDALKQEMLALKDRVETSADETKPDTLMKEIEKAKEKVSDVLPYSAGQAQAAAEGGLFGFNIGKIIAQIQKFIAGIKLWFAQKTGMSSPEEIAKLEQELQQMDEAEMNPNDLRETINGYSEGKNISVVGGRRDRKALQLFNSKYREWAQTSGGSREDFVRVLVDEYLVDVPSATPGQKREVTMYGLLRGQEAREAGTVKNLLGATETVDVEGNSFEVGVEESGVITVDGVKWRIKGEQEKFIPIVNKSLGKSPLDIKILNAGYVVRQQEKSFRFTVEASGKKVTQEYDEQRAASFLQKLADGTAPDAISGTAAGGFVSYTIAFEKI